MVGERHVDSVRRLVFAWRLLVLDNESARGVYWKSMCVCVF